VKEVPASSYFKNSYNKKFLSVVVQLYARRWNWSEDHLENREHGPCQGNHSVCHGQGQGPTYAGHGHRPSLAWHEHGPYQGNHSASHEHGPTYAGHEHVSSLACHEHEPSQGNHSVCQGQGLNKAGQLGLGNGSGSVTTPQWVAHLHTEGHKVAKVSCGFHHTMIIAVPIHAIRVFQTALFTCGWGEHGRLGLGDEDERLLPTMVKFATPFHPLHISAGEQHSLASGKEGCYSWGSNTMGQLGIGNPSITEFALTPTKIPLPEGMVLAKIAAGGRHSAGITRCGKVLAWGWGEEGQLGHGSEKNTYLPRPCRVPRVKGKLGHPIDIALGMSHTIVTVKNNAYVEKLPTPIPSPVKVAIVEPPPIVEEVKEVPLIEVYEEEIPLPEVVEEEEEVVIREPSPEPQEEPLQELQPEPEPVIVAIRSIKELLEQRLQREVEQVLHAVVEEEPPVEIQEKVVEKVVETVFIEPEVEPAPLPVEPNNVIKLEPIKKPVEDKYKIYYKDGQNYDNCLIANSAKRAEMRRLKKLQQQGK